MGLFDFFTQEIAMDLGTANTIIYYQDKVVVDEPSIVAKDRMTGNVVPLVAWPSKCTGKPTRTSRPSARSRTA